MGILACIGVILPFPFYYYLWNHPQSWVNLCGRSRDPCKIMALVSHFIKIVQFVSLFSVSDIHWPPPFYFWPLFLFGQFLNFRFAANFPLHAMCLLFGFLEYFVIFDWFNSISYSCSGRYVIKQA